MDTARGTDPVREDRIAVFGAWRDELDVNKPYTVREIVSSASEYGRSSIGHESFLVRPALHDALIAVAKGWGKNDGSQTTDTRRLGIWLKNNEDKVVDHHKLTVDRSDGRRPRWTIKPRS